MAFSHLTRPPALFLGIVFALASADATLAQRRINPVVLAPVSTQALPRQFMQVDGALAAPLDQFFVMEDWLPLLGMLGLLPIEKQMAQQRVAQAFPVAWQALYERRLSREPHMRASAPTAARR
jgi:hypothetical protein